MFDDKSDNAKKILTVVRQIPKGKVATYGQIASLAGIPRNSRQVGSVLKNLATGSRVPWFRVVNSKGEISLRADGKYNQVQRQALEEEKVRFDHKARISLDEFGWKPHEIED